MKKLTLFLVAMTMSLLSFAQSQMSGTYTVGTGGSYDYSSMADAGMAIKSAEFTGDVTLLICTDLTETINTGIVNKSEYILTIRPDKDENRTITYTTATDNTGPTGVFVIGGDMTKTPGSTIGWASVPTRNVIVDGAAEGKTTPRLKITTGKWATNFLLYGDVQDCVVKNCILENTGTASANYALTFRSENYSKTSKNIGPKNCLVENCVLEATHATKSQTVYFQGNQANSAAGHPANITIRNCNIKAHTRGMFLYGVNGLNVEGCTFDLSDMASGLMCHGILGNTVKGTINVKGNKFIKNSTKNTYAGEYGLQTITASGGATLWVIENNYFAGYNAVASGTTTKESRLVGIRCGDPCEIRHNTFYMPKLTYAPATPLVGTHAVALLWLAGSHKYPVQNNIFVCEETTANVSLIRGGLNENVTGNVFYHKGGNAAIVAAAPSCMIFADLETSYPTQAATSKWTNVTFADAANGDLSLAGNSNGDETLAVSRLAEVLTDITGKSRREQTYAGAYEGANFPSNMPSSITLTAYPVQDYSASIVGTMKRAIQNGENTIVLTHEADGTPHIYSIEHSTKTVTELSQEGVVARDPENAGDYLSISDIALTEDGKLVASNYMRCEQGTTPAEGYKVGEIRYYIWDNINTAPTRWFTTNKTANSSYADVSYTFAIKGTSTNAQLMSTAVHNNNRAARINLHTVVNGAETAYHRFGLHTSASEYTEAKQGTNFQITATPLDNIWALEGELTDPTSFAVPATLGDPYTGTALKNTDLGKKYTGASYLNYDGHYLMVAPYANGEGKLAGVKVLGITLGFEGAISVATSTDLSNAIDATAAAATAYVDGDGDLTIYLIADAKVYAFSQKVPTKYTISARASNNSMGYVTGGGTYYAGETVTLKAVANSTYCFVNWSDGNTDATRTFTATADVTLTANFAKASPRAWAYDLKMVEDGDNYKFSFNATTAANATLLFLDKEGNELYTAHEVGAVAAGANTVSIEKAYFTQVKDVYWSVKMDGEAITSVAEITDQTLGLYDFYSMRGVVVDNNPNSNDFGKVYLQMPVGGTSNGKERTSGLYIFDQKMNSLNNDPYRGIVPTVPSGYTFGNASNQFHRLNINPNTGNLVYSYSVSGLPAIFAIDRDNITNEVTNLLSGVSGLSTVTRTGAHCFDNEGNLYILDIYPYSNTKYPQGWYGNGIIYKIVDGVATKLVENTNWANESITLASDGRGGLWVSQNRGQMDGFYQLAHVTSEGDIDWYVNKNSTHGLDGGAARGALAYDVERQILAQGRNSRVEVFSVAYDATTGVPTLTQIATTPQVNKPNIDALAFDYAGDLYVANSGTEKLYKYTLPTADNICTVPAPKSQAIMFTPQVTVTINVVGNGTTTGAGTYDQGSTITLKAIAQANNRFVNWTKGEEVVSTETTYSFVVTEDVTLTANFVAIPQYAITVETSNADQGSVTGGGTYYEGSTATLTATPVGGYVFEKWSDDNTDNPRTITVNGAAKYTAIFKVAPARVFAYNLDVVDNGDETYTLSFIPNANATSGRVILYNDDTKEQIHEAPIADAIVKGVKSEVVISKSGSWPTVGTVTWAVELTGETVEQLTLLSDPTKKDIYGFNRPQGVAIDNNPASDFFGRIYIALPKAGGTDYSDTNYGIVVMDPQHNRLKSGVVANGDVLGANGRYSMHRVAVNPTNGHVYYVRTSDSSEGVTGTAIYELTPDATNVLTDGGTAKNVINGISEITNANSVCFDETGAMYVVANASYDNTNGSTGRVYKVVDGEATLVTQSSRELASKDNSIVPDGKGGFWIAQHRNNLDGFNHLLHINASGAADYTIDNATNTSLLPVQTYTQSGTTYKNASYRGQVAYYSIDENNGLVAYGGGAKVSVFKATYDGSGVPTLESWQTISLLSQSSKEGIHVDGIAFDYAGNIIVMSATDERMYQYALPIETANTSLVPSPTSKAIKLGTIYTVEVAVNDPAMGTATGAGEYLEGETAIVEATANADYRFVNWTNAGVEVSTNKTYSFTVTERVTLTANFAPLPEIAYELNGGVWNKYGWTSKKDMYNALLDDWRAYSGESRQNTATYEQQLGIGNSSKGIPTTITTADHRVALWNLFTDATYAPKWGWLATYVDAVAATQYKKMNAANGVKTQPTSAAGVFTFTIGNFFGEDNAHSTDYIDAVDFTGAEAQPQAFQPTWGQSLPHPTQPRTAIVLGTPYKENYRFDGWYAAADFSGEEVTTVDQNTGGTIYAKWVAHFYTHTPTNKYGTICLPYASASTTGAYFYEVAGKEEGKVYLASVDALEAGVPYIFEKTASTITVFYTGEAVSAPQNDDANGLVGTFEEIAVPDGDYILYNDAFRTNEPGGTLNRIRANRAYLNMDGVTGSKPTPMPGRRYIGMDVEEENETTGFKNIQLPNANSQKLIINGQLIIIRDGEMYNAQGQKL